ncbi:MAG: hypothetical protein HQL82_16030 [Magnetococcales bacterium]|nr:hypothetical protein [Magnetococcales bacterium]
MSSETDNAGMLQLTGLWARTSKHGTAYMAGRLGGCKVLILPNRNRQGDNDPSHHICLAPTAPKRDGGSHQCGYHGRTQQPQPQGQATPDDVPF